MRCTSFDQRDLASYSSGGLGVPDEVEAGLDGVAVVDAVVAEHPGLEDVQRRQHGDASDDAVEAAALEQGLVGGVVADDEECR